MMIEHVAIVGAGFSGTLQAINLLRHQGPRTTLIERAPVAGQGIAYGAAHPSHVLNVRASNMSAFPDDPGHFVRWLEADGVSDAAHAFAPRVTYGAYLREMLQAAIENGSGRLTLVHGEAVDVHGRDHDAEVTLADGRAISAGAVILASGNLPPHSPSGMDPRQISTERYRSDPWADGVTQGLGPSDTVLIVGTGLTMVDMALTLEAQGFAGRILAISRRGLIPRVHDWGMGDWEPRSERPKSRATSLLRDVRGRARAIGWRNAVDELRPYTRAVWAMADPPTRERFLRHLRPWWDVHRHRLAPQVAAHLAAMLASGQLQVRAGKTVAFKENADGIAVTWRPRGVEEEQRVQVTRVINCTGPQGDLTRTTDTLLQRLYANGYVRPDAARLGIDVDSYGQAVDSSGTSSRWLLAIGPMTRGAFWEIVAVPDIRAQSWTVARRLSNAHWIGGEGL